MELTQEILVGLVILAVIAAAILVWALRSAKPEAPKVDRTPAKPPLADLPPLPIAPAPEHGIVAPEAVPPGVVITDVAAPELAVEPAPTGPPDDLQRMKGVGPKLVATLNGLGVTRFDQIAAWSDANAQRIDSQLGTFKGRIGRDRWIEQARFLAADDVKGFEAMFGKL